MGANTGEGENATLCCLCARRVDGDTQMCGPDFQPYVPKEETAAMAVPPGEDCALQEGRLPDFAEVEVYDQNTATPRLSCCCVLVVLRWALQSYGAGALYPFIGDGQLLEPR